MKEDFIEEDFIEEDFIEEEEIEENTRPPAGHLANSIRDNVKMIKNSVRFPGDDTEERINLLVSEVDRIAHSIIADRLKQAMKKKKITVDELAKRCPIWLKRNLTPNPNYNKDDLHSLQFKEENINLLDQCINESIVWGRDNFYACDLPYPFIADLGNLFILERELGYGAGEIVDPNLWSTEVLKALGFLNDRNGPTGKAEKLKRFQCENMRAQIKLDVQRRRSQEAERVAKEQKKERDKHTEIRRKRILKTILSKFQLDEVT